MRTWLGPCTYPDIFPIAKYTSGRAHACTFYLSIPADAFNCEQSDHPTAVHLSGFKTSAVSEGGRSEVATTRTIQHVCRSARKTYMIFSCAQLYLGHTHAIVRYTIGVGSSFWPTIIFLPIQYQPLHRLVLQPFIVLVVADLIQ